MKFRYNKKIDKECWERIVNAGEIFGHEAPSFFEITKTDIKNAKEKTKEFQRIWDKAKPGFQKGIKKIYGHYFPQNVICYINTSFYSMDAYPKYISVSMHRKNIVTAVIHEASHFIFRKYYLSFCRDIGCDQNDIEKIKEIITVINNTAFNDVTDFGWKIHQKTREKAQRAWQKNHNIKILIKQIKKFDKFDEILYIKGRENGTLQTEY